jgi:hypothetical protein
VNLPMALHSDFKVKFTVDEVTQMFECTSGFKQGDIITLIHIIYGSRL